MGKFSQPRGQQPIRVPPVSSEEKITIGEQKAAAANEASGLKATLAKNRKIILISVCAVAAVLLISTIVGICVFLGNPADDGLIRGARIQHLQTGWSGIEKVFCILGVVYKLDTPPPKAICCGIQCCCGVGNVHGRSFHGSASFHAPKYA